MIRATYSTRGMVSAPHHLAAQAGRDVLAEGGSAIEAMVAMAAAIAVVYPHMTGIGGDGFWLIQLPGEAEPRAIEACGPAAALATPDFYTSQGDTAIPTRGPRAALTVAGAVAGWATALALAAEQGGGMPLARLLAPAIAWARSGIVVTDSQASLSAAKHAELASVPGFADLLYQDGAPPARGSVLTLPALAGSLERIAEAGPDDFYRGDLARRMAAGLEAAGSPLRLGDLEAYRARSVTPMSVGLRSGRVFNMPPPTQGVSSLMILGLFERLGVSEAEGFAYVHGLVEATKAAFRRRDAHVGEPNRMTVDPADWLTPVALDGMLSEIDPARAAPWPEAGGAGDTVWMGAADERGIAVSYIQSVFWEFGSGLVAGDTGVCWQNRGASFTLGPGPNHLAPGARPFHTLNPALARLDDGATLAYGTMGGEGQPQTQAALFTRHVSFAQDLQAAITAPRWLLGRTWGAETTSLKLESRFDPALIDSLAAAGHVVEVVEPYSDQMGHAGAVKIRADGVFEGATDPRADGMAAGL